MQDVEALLALMASPLAGGFPRVISNAAFPFAFTYLVFFEPRRAIIGCLPATQASAALSATDLVRFFDQSVFPVLS